MGTFTGTTMGIRLLSWGDSSCNPPREPEKKKKPKKGNMNKFTGSQERFKRSRSEK